MSESIDTDAVEVESVALEPIAERDLGGIERRARELQPKLAQRTHRINGKDYLGIDGLTLAATAEGIVGVITETRRLENGHEAHAEARIVADGRVVGAGVSVCTRDEPRWARRADFELLGMAQTRALSRALRGPVGALVSLASYSTTPAEEVDSATLTVPPTPELPGWAKPIADAEVARAAHALVAILKAAGVPEPDERTIDIGKRIRDRCDRTIPRGVLGVIEDIRGQVAPADDAEAA